MTLKPLDRVFIVNRNGTGMIGEPWLHAGAVWATFAG